jgi:uracil-DNA glycosylase family 4
MFVAEAPGIEEDALGYPFVDHAKTGREFNDLLLRNGFNRESVYVTNMVKCHPPGNRDPSEGERKKCMLWLLEELAGVDPKYVITVGRVSTRELLGDVSMADEHGIPREWINPGTGSVCTVMPVYHPAAGLHDPSLMLQVQKDFELVKLLVLGKIPNRPVKDMWPSPEYTNANVMNVTTDLNGAELLSIDTEWARGKPWCMSYSIRSGMARVIMADQQDCIKVIADKVADPGVMTLIHNALYDLPVLEQMGIYVARPADTMVMAYLLQSEPQGLKSLAYRMCGMKMSEYSDMVADATHRNAMKYLAMVLEGEWDDPKEVLVWENGTPRVKKPQSIKKKVERIFMDILDKGESVSPRDRWLRMENREHVEKILGPMLEGDLSDIHMEDAIRYSARDADATIRVYEHLWKKIVEYGLEDTFWRDMRAMPMVVDMMRSGIAIDPGHFVELSGYLANKMSETETAITALTGENINPGSPMQVSKLLYDKLDMRKLFEEYFSSEFGTGDKILARMVASPKVNGETKSIVQHIRDWRSYQKLKTSYSDVIPGMAIKDQNGIPRIHSTFRMTRTTTGRLSSSDPNLMAQPVRTSEGRRIRDGYIASDGCTLVSADYSQVEMRVAASCSGDRTMCKIFVAGLDIHAQTASAMFGIKIDELDEMKHRYPAKRVGFGVLNDITAEGLQREMIVGGANAEDWPVDRCGELIKEWFKVYSGVARYMEESRTMAKRYGYVTDLWGRRRWIPHARSRNKSMLEEALRQAGNAPIQMGAQGIIKQAMGDMVPAYEYVRKSGGTWNPLIQIHDDLVMEVGDDWLDPVIAIMTSIMESADLGKLLVPLKVDIKRGKRWGSMEKQTPNTV